MQFITIYIAGPVPGWRGPDPQLTWKGADLLKAVKLQPFSPPKDLAICLETGLSSLQPQGMLLLACLIASLIKTWRAVSNMIPPAEQLKLSQHFCACVWCMQWIAKMYGSNSWCHEFEQTWAAQVLCLFNGVPVPNLSLNFLWQVIPGGAGRTEHMSTHLLQCKVQQPDFVTTSQGDQASAAMFCLLLFLNAPPKYKFSQRQALRFALWS